MRLTCHVKRTCHAFMAGLSFIIMNSILNQCVCFVWDVLKQTRAVLLNWFGGNMRMVRSLCVRVSLEMKVGYVKGVLRQCRTRSELAAACPYTWCFSSSWKFELTRVRGTERQAFLKNVLLPVSNDRSHCFSTSLSTIFPLSLFLGLGSCKRLFE